LYLERPKPTLRANPERKTTPKWGKFNPKWGKFNPKWGKSNLGYQLIVDNLWITLYILKKKEVDY